MKKFYSSSHTLLFKKRLLLLIFLFIASRALKSQTIWDGPTTVFTKPAFGSPTAQSNQDRITAAVWLTRANTQGIYNAYAETSYGSTSPFDTEWAYGQLSNYASLTYTDWVTFNAKNPPSMVGKDAVVHLISENIYIGIKFLSWDARPSTGGGFSYQRTTAPALPVTLRAFTASLQNNNAVLSWTTAAEVNNAFFDIEHSTDAHSFVSIGRVNGAGNSASDHAYSFTHTGITAGKHYYRLAQHDKDGDTKYSSVIMLSVGKRISVQVRPNPATSFITLTGSSIIDGLGYKVVSTNGQTVQKGILRSQQLDVRQLGAGQYYVTIQQSNGAIITTSFIKNQQ